MIDIHAVSGNVSEAMNKAWKIVFVMILVLGAICALIILIIKLCWGLFFNITMLNLVLFIIFIAMQCCYIWFKSLVT